MNWKEYYKQHLMSAEDAVNHIQSGNRVVVAHACGEPSYLLDVMVANAKAYRDVEIVHMVAMGKAEYCKPEYAGNFRHNAFFVGGTSRDMVIGKGAFPSLWLANWLKEQGYDRVELAGLVSYLCVLSNAIMVKAALPEAEIVVDASCTAGPDPDLHAKGLDVMEALQITVLNR